VTAREIPAFAVHRKHPGRAPCPRGPEGTTICRLRKATGLTQAEAARLFGVCTDTWNSWETARHRPHRALLRWLLGGLEREGKRRNPK
jgi:DNA-binding transcriptional regulator YiaG